MKSMSNGGTEMMGKNPTYSEKNTPECHFAHSKSHTDWPEVETRPPL
jgi:hypothetical protein